MITIATWNINSIKARLEPVLAWLEQHKPDLLLLQEIKCINEKFPSEVFAEIGYHATVHGMPAYHGVAILSCEPVELISNSILQDDTQARFLHVRFRQINVLNLYAPNGNPIGTEKFDYKLRWLNEFQHYIEKLRAKRHSIIAAGDFNIIPTAHDARNPQEWVNDALYQPPSIAAWRRLLNTGMIDAYRAKHPNDYNAYTFWDYQAGSWQRDNGIRIDHALLSPDIADRLHKVWIDKQTRDGERPSDHVPLVLQLN